MAKIEIEKKKTIWPWILLAILVIAAILYFFVFANDDDDFDNDDEVTTEQVIQEEQEETESTYDSLEEMTAVQDYGEYIENPDMGLDHEYANGALLKLIAATRAVAQKNEVDIDAELDEAKSKAEKITEDPMKLTHANKIKDAGETITRALKTIQSEKFPDMGQSYMGVEEALGKIKPDDETLNQKDAIKSFFDKADELLISMK